MSDIQKTITIVAVAVVLAVLAFLLAPSRITPDAFLDQGEAFFPDFTDPNEAVTLEVVDYDERTGSAHPFKVTFADGRWTIPSHHDYPADAKDRLAKTAAGVIGINKDDFRSDNVADHESFGVIDPLDDAVAGLSGRGKRVTFKGADGRVLADFVVGKEVEGRQGMRFVRIPDQKRVYAVRMDVDLSTRFQDWIETDLLQVNIPKAVKVTLNDYSINERTGTVDRKDNLVFVKRDDQWRVRNMPQGKEVDSTKMAALLTAIDSLSIVGVRPKPEGLSRTLQESGDMKLDRAEMMSLQNKGFFIANNGQLMSNEGELLVETSDGIEYTLRFGEILTGSGLAVSAGTESGESGQAGSSENRYLFVTTSFEERLLPEPPRPGDTSFVGKADSLLTDTDRENREKYRRHNKWERDIRRGRELNESLNSRFADWYYVISAESFDRLRVKRSDMLVAKE